MSEYQEKIAELKEGLQQENSIFSPSETGFSPSEDGNKVNEEQSLSDGVSYEPKEVPFSVNPRKKQVNSFKKRIDQLTYENKVKEAQTQELIDRVRQQEQLLAEKQYQLQQNEQHKNAYYEDNLRNREVSITNELKVAKEEGDVDREIALSKALAKVTAEQSTYGLYKSQLQPKTTDYYDQSQEELSYPAMPIDYGQPIDYGEPQNEFLDNWLEKNPWADPESSQFSPNLRNEINGIANEVENILHYHGYSDTIGTAEYFDYLDNVMRDRYNLNQAQSLPQQYQNQTVAPVNRAGSSLADQYVNNNSQRSNRATALTEEEYKLARSLQMKAPNGGFITPEEAVNRYVKYKNMGYDPQHPTRLVIT